MQTKHWYNMAQTFDLKTFAVLREQAIDRLLMLPFPFSCLPNHPRTLSAWLPFLHSCSTCSNLTSDFNSCTDWSTPCLYASILISMAVMISYHAILTIKHILARIASPCLSITSNPVSTPPFMVIILMLVHFLMMWSCNCELKDSWKQSQ